MIVNKKDWKMGKLEEDSTTSETHKQQPSKQARDILQI